MFHVEHAVPDGLAVVVNSVFAGRVDTAIRYHQALATAGVERGLIGPREVPRLWDRHLLNCAVVGELIDQGATLVDVGSGAGLPGIPLAIARPDLAVTLVEPLLRRATFLAETIAELGLANVTVIRGRAEDKAVVTAAGGSDVVTSRAVAPLLKLATWSLPLIHRDGVMLAMKGDSAKEELERDARGLRSLGAVPAGIELCGVGLLTPPTTVLRLRKGAPPQSRSRRQA